MKVNRSIQLLWFFGMIIAIILVAIKIKNQNDKSNVLPRNEIQNKLEVMAGDLPDNGKLRTSGREDLANRPPMIEEVDHKSFRQLLSDIQGIKDTSRRREMLDQLVSIHGLMFSSEVYDFLSQEMSDTDSRVPILRLGVINVTNNPNVFYKALADFAPGKDRSALLRVALLRMSAEELSVLFEKVVDEGYPEDGKIIYQLVNQEKLFQRSDLEDSDLSKLLENSRSDEVSSIIVKEIARRKALSIDHIDQIGLIGVGVPLQFREDFLDHAYSEYLERGEASESVDELAGNGVPSHLLNKYVKSLANRRFGNLGPDLAIESAQGISGEYRRIYLGEISRRWISDDSIGASKAIGLLPEGRDRDFLIGEIVNYSLGAGEVETAKHWVPLVQDEEIRNVMLEKVEKIEKSGSSK